MRRERDHRVSSPSGLLSPQVDPLLSDVPGTGHGSILQLAVSRVVSSLNGEHFLPESGWLLP
jgi:hypothetical protein